MIRTSLSALQVVFSLPLPCIHYVFFLLQVFPYTHRQIQESLKLRTYTQYHLAPNQNQF